MYEKFQQYVSGLITKDEFFEYCQSVNIHGAVEVKDDKVRFVAHDYKNQTWIRFN